MYNAIKAPGSARTIGWITLIAAIVAAHPVLAAQVPSGRNSRWEFVVASGTLVPTAAQRDSFRRAELTVAQFSYVVRPDVAINATVGWARNVNLVAAPDARLDVFTYDLGAESRPVRWDVGIGKTLGPFAGIGAGARSYNYRNRHVDATHNLAGYLSAGGEFGVRRFRLRLEIRDYVTGFKPLDGQGPGAARNDVVATLGLRIVSRQP